MARNITLVIFVLILSSAFLLASCSFLNPYESEIGYKNESFSSVNYEIPGFWKQPVNKSLPADFRFQNSRLYEDGKDYTWMLLSVEDAGWDMASLEGSSENFLNASVSMAIANSGFFKMFDIHAECDTKCKERLNKNINIKAFPRDSPFRVMYDECFKKCREESSIFNVENYGNKKLNFAAKKTAFKDGINFTAESIGLKCSPDKVVYLLFAVDTDKKSDYGAADEIIVNITKSVKCG